MVCGRSGETPITAAPGGTEVDLLLTHILPHRRPLFNSRRRGMPKSSSAAQAPIASETASTSGQQVEDQDDHRQ
jgi:hypothetical protein